VKPLLINEKILADIAAVRDYALEPENLYDPGQSPQPPGDDPRHVVLVPVNFRCVFSITRWPDDDQLYRHLSISLFERDAYPNAAAAFMLAESFGFTGWDYHALTTPGPDWLLDTHEHAAVIAQKLGEPTDWSKARPVTFHNLKRTPPK
jgi:hypothetical protein